jgi:archaetidylinositol phosphate synthase
MEHTREHLSVLARGEKKLLIRIARSLPRCISSDQLTILALIGMVIAAVGYLLLRWNARAVWIPVAGLFINWFGDSLDGTVARVRGMERPRYGFYVDHIVDIVGATLLLGGLAASTLMSPLVSLGLLIAYLLVSGEVFLATAVHRTFRLSFAGVGPTELRFALALGTLFLGRATVDLGALGPWIPFDIGAAVGAAGLIAALVVSTARNTAALYRLEPLPRQAFASAEPRHTPSAGTGAASPA